MRTRTLHLPDVPAEDFTMAGERTEFDRKRLGQACQQRKSLTVQPHCCRPRVGVVIDTHCTLQEDEQDGVDSKWGAGQEREGFGPVMLKSFLPLDLNASKGGMDGCISKHSPI